MEYEATSKADEVCRNCRGEYMSHYNGQCRQEAPADVARPIKRTLSAKQDTVLTSVYYGKGVPRRTSYRTIGRLKALDLMHFDLPRATYVLTEAGRERVTSRPWFAKNAWLWTGERRP